MKRIKITEVPTNVGTRRRGFTLIELLVVIGIIAMLIAIAIPNYLSARQRAADSKMKSEMTELKNALRLYYNDFQSYPLNFNGGIGKINYIQGCGNGGTGTCPCGPSADFASSTDCSDVYMKQFPSGFGSTIYYYQSAGGNDFCLTGSMQNTSDPDIATGLARCGVSCTINNFQDCTSGKYCLCSD